MKQVTFPLADSGSPDSPEWHLWRSNGIGGSDAPVIAADAGLVTRATWMPTLHQLWEMKVGLRARPKSNPAMARGRRFESIAREKYTQITGIKVDPLFGEMDLYPEVRVSFDGVSDDRRIILEIKVPGVSTHENAKLGIVPSYYEAQVAQQGMVLWGPAEQWPADVEIHFATYSIDLDEVAIVEYSNNTTEAMVRLDRVKEIAIKLLPLVSVFWMHVAFKTPPGQKMDEWSVAAHEYRKADEAEGVAKAMKEKAKEVLINLAGDSPKRSGAGVSVSTYNRQGSVDNKKIIEDAVSRELVDLYLRSQGIGDEIRKMLLDSMQITDEMINATRGLDSVSTKISIEKDYIPPIENLVVVYEMPVVSDEPRSYSW